MLLAGEGERLRIAGFTAGGKFAAKMIDLGLTVGSEVEVIQRQPNGPLILGKGDVRVGVGMGMAYKIMVVLSGGAVR